MAEKYDDLDDLATDKPKTYSFEERAYPEASSELQVALKEQRAVIIAFLESEHGRLERVVSSAHINPRQPSNLETNNAFFAEIRRVSKTTMVRNIDKNDAQQEIMTNKFMAQAPTMAVAA